MIKISNVLLASASLFSLIPVSQAFGQSAEDVVVMRRVITPKRGGSSVTPTPTPTPSPTSSAPSGFTPVDGANTNDPFWATTAWTFPNPTCSDAVTITRNAACIHNGQIVADSSCANPKPTVSEITADYRTCSYEYRTLSEGQWSNTCGEAVKPIVSGCFRKSTNTQVSDEFCVGEKPSEISGYVTSGCSYSWQLVSSEQPTCGQVYACTRSDGASVPDTFCSVPKPEITSCGEYSWMTSAWEKLSSSCGGNVQQVRSVTCTSSDGTPVSDSFCTGTKPSTEMSAQDFSSCTFDWSTGDWSNWNSECSANAERSRGVSCLRSDGTSSNPSNCTSEKPSETETQAVFSGCSFSWYTTNWSVVPSCSESSTRTRTVACRRSDGTDAPESSCTDAKPASSEVIADYSNCSYSWETSAYTFDSSCSDAANGVRSVTCIRGDSNSSPVSDSFCTEQKPSATVIQSIYTGCPADWTVSNWGEWSSTCSGSANKTRTVACSRIQPSSTVAVENSNCNTATRPVASETSANYTGCQPYWSYGSWGWNGITGEKSSSCSASPQQTRTAICQKINTSGVLETIDDSFCSGVQKDPLTQGLQSDYSGCSYAWSPNDTTTGWSAWSSQCSATATRSRTVSCLRDDGTAVNDSYCLGTKPATSESMAIFSNCQNVVKNAGFESPVALSTTPPSGGGWYFSALSGASLSQSTDAVEGTYSLSINATSVNRVMKSTGGNITVTGNYSGSFRCKALSGSGSINIQQASADMTTVGYISGTPTCGSSWTTINIPVRNYTAIGDVQIGVRMNGTGIILFDDFIFKQSQ